jgi:hypothetical protein
MQNSLAYKHIPWIDIDAHSNLFTIIGQVFILGKRQMDTL